MMNSMGPWDLTPNVERRNRRGDTTRLFVRLVRQESKRRRQRATGRASWRGRLGALVGRLLSVTRGRR